MVCLALLVRLLPLIATIIDIVQAQVGHDFSAPQVTNQRSRSDGQPDQIEGPNGAINFGQSSAADNTANRGPQQHSNRHRMSMLTPEQPSAAPETVTRRPRLGSVFTNLVRDRFRGRATRASQPPELHRREDYAGAREDRFKFVYTPDNNEALAPSSPCGQDHSPGFLPDSPRHSDGDSRSDAQQEDPPVYQSEVPRGQPRYTPDSRDRPPPYSERLPPLHNTLRRSPSKTEERSRQWWHREWWRRRRWWHREWWRRMQLRRRNRS